MRNINKWKAAAVVCALLAAAWFAVSIPDGTQAPSSPEGGADAPAAQAGIQETAAIVQGGPLSAEYEKVAENDRLILYLKEENLAIRVEEKRSGYVWSSVIEDEASRNNASWKNFMSSGLSIEYYKADIPQPERTDLISEKNKSIAVKKTDDGFTASVKFGGLNIALDVNVKLDGDQLIVSIPNESIRESEKAKLASVFAYPFLGATRKGEVPGYMFIPDGSGALIGLQDNESKYKLPYEAKIYGANEGIERVPRDKLTNPPYRVQFPVFGIVHGEGEHGLFGIVENGQFNAKIVAYPNGANTDYNWITAQYLSRETYLQPTSRAMGGVIVQEKNRNPEDIRTRYIFLSGKEAGYAGMAKAYRNYLQQKGELERQSGATGDIPMQIDVLGAESKGGLFFNQLIPMTTVKQVKDIVADVKKNGIANPVVVYKGWNKGGLSGTGPSDVRFEGKLGSGREFADFIRDMDKEGVPLYFYDDYTTAYEESGRFAARTDAAKKLDKTVLSLPTNKDVFETYYYMSADKSVSLAKENAKRYAEKGIRGVAVANTGNILFSEWDDGKVKSRADTASAYRELMGRLSESGSVALYSPNDYMLKFADRVLDVPMHSSQYIYTSETVPFVQMVLKGYKDYFAPYANFFANSKEELLRMVEYGAYPSYYLTHESSYKLKFTNSDDVYTSAYKDWKQEMAATYEAMNGALKEVRGATIEDRIKPAPGIVEMVYSNGKAIVVNYNGADFDVNGTKIPARGFKVIEVKR